MNIFLLTYLMTYMIEKWLISDVKVRNNRDESKCECLRMNKKYFKDRNKVYLIDWRPNEMKL